MFSASIKRSVITVGVVAGLLAAAGPASAQGGGADSTRLAGSGAHVATFGTYDPVEHRAGDQQRAAGGAHGLKSDGNEVAVEGFAGRDGDTITHARESARTVTMLDYMGSP